ncbi:response regulator [bacterium]|nr:response regulator [bacterium]
MGYSRLAMADGAAKILVIEDAHDLMRLMVRILESAGFTVIQAYGGEDALRKVRTHHPDLVLTDLAMPLMSGVEVIERIKRTPESASIPCVAVTAFMWDQIASAAGRVGCDGFVGKPFTSATLLAEVAKHVPLPTKMRAAG